MRKSRRRKEHRRQLLSLLLCAAMTVSLWPAAAFADSDTETQTETVSEAEVAEGELCTNHPEHTEDCYELVELPCTHEHTEECYDPDDLAERVASASDWEDLEPVECSHVCSVESGCLEEELNCSHVHTDDCRALTGDDADGEEELELMSLGLDGNDVLRSAKASQDNRLAIQIRANAIDDPNGVTPSDYLYFGSWNGAPVKWRVLDADQSSTGEYGEIFLLSEDVLESAVEPDSWCSSFANTAFTTAEQNSIADTDAESSRDLMFSSGWNLGELDGEKAFFLSSLELAKMLSESDCTWESGDSNFIAKYDGKAENYWLRSTYATNDDERRYGYVNTDGDVNYDHGDVEAGARPAINLETFSLVFTTPADNSGHYESFSKVGSYTGKEWKAVLCDDTDFSEDFWLSGGSLTLPAGYAAETLTFNHPSLASANETYTNLTAMLMDTDGDILWYGSVNDDPTATSSTFTVPAGLSAGTYTLLLLGEDWNEAKETDYVCGMPYRTTLTVGETEEGFAEQVLSVSGNTGFDCNLTVTLDGENGSPEYRCWIPGGTGWTIVKFLNGSHTFTLSKDLSDGASLNMYLPVGTQYTVSYSAENDLPEGTRLTVAEGEGDSYLSSGEENLLTVEQDLGETNSFSAESYVVKENTSRFLNFYFFRASEMSQIVIGKRIRTVDVKVDAAPGQNLGAIMEEMRQKYEAMKEKTVTEQAAEEPTVMEEPVKFVFDLQLTDRATGSAYTGAYYLGSDTSKALYPDENGVAKVSLAAGETCIVSVPASVTYTLTEEPAEGYSLVKWSYQVQNSYSEALLESELYEEAYEGTALRGRDSLTAITAWNQTTGEGQTGSVSVSKLIETENVKITEFQLSGNKFPFTINLWIPGAEDSTGVDGTYRIVRNNDDENTESLVVSGGSGSFEIGPDETVLITGLPAGARYEITEGEDSTGTYVFNRFETILNSSATDLPRILSCEKASGTVLSNTTQNWTAVNNKKTEAGNLTISKYVTSSNPADLRRAFRFRITLQDLAGKEPAASVRNVNDRYETSQTFRLEAGEGLLLSEDPEGEIALLSEDLPDERDYQDVRTTRKLTFDANGVAYVKLYSGETLNLNQIPYGSSYKVEEILDSGAVCTVLVNGSLAVTETSGSEKLAAAEGTVGFATAATFDNIVSKGILTLSKDVVNKTGHEDETYAFTVKLTDRYGTALKGTYGVIYSDDETRTMKNRTLVNGTLTESLADGGYLMIVGLPDGAKYTVTEAASDAYTTAAANGTQTVSGSAISGTVSIGTPEEITFTNTWPEPTPEPEPTPDPDPETPDTPDGGGSETPDTPDDGGGSETPDTPDDGGTETPTTPSSSSGHRSGGGGGGSSSHSVSTGTVTGGGPGVTASSETQASSETGTTGGELVEIAPQNGTGEADSTPGGLPKTGQEGANWLLLLLSALTAAAVLFLTAGKKKNR